MMAVRKKNADTAQCLINHGADIGFKDANGDSPLHMAVEAGSTELIALLAKNGANLNQVNSIVRALPEESHLRSAPCPRPCR
jgi:ankyrin repeat protein